MKNRYWVIVLILWSVGPLLWQVYTSFSTPENLIKDIVPDVLVKGGDYNIEDIVGYQIVIKNGGQVKTLSFYDGYSSTNYIDKINKR